MPVVDRIALALPAVGIEDLAEIPFRVGEADADQRQTEVARGLQVVSREHAQAARVDGKALVEAVLHREVGDARAACVREGLAEPPFALHVALQRLPGRLQVTRKRVVPRKFVESCLIDQRQELYRVAVHLFPKVRIDADEKLVRHGGPRPPKVVGDFAQTFDSGGKARDDCEAPQNRHASVSGGPARAGCTSGHAIVRAIVYRRPVVGSPGIACSSCA